MKKSLLAIVCAGLLLTACGKNTDNVDDVPIDGGEPEVEAYDLNASGDSEGDVSSDDEVSHESFIGSPYLISGKVSDYTLTALSVDIVRARGNVHQYITDPDFQLSNDEALVLVTLMLSTDTPNITQQIVPEQFAIMYNGKRYLGTSELDTNFMNSCILSVDAPQQITVPFLLPNTVRNDTAIQFMCGDTTIYL